MNHYNKAEKPLRICLDARLIEGTVGGVEQFIIGLAYGLSLLPDGNEEYLFLAYENADEWIRHYISGPCHILHVPKAPAESIVMASLRRSAPRIDKIFKKLYPVSDRWRIKSLWSDGTIESAHADLMHFTHQIAFFTHVPSIYHPHDLQHIHLPQYYSLTKHLMREIIYRFFCSRAKMVAVANSWTRSDIISRYHLPADKVQVIPFAPPISAYKGPVADDFSDTRMKFSLPESFIFYPAQTWPHKNHIRLLDALASIRDQHHISIHAVFSGLIYEPFFPEIKRHIRELQLDGQIHFLGYVRPIEMQCLYRSAKCVVIPSKFEAGSFPLWEAFQSRVPSACSNVTSLPDQAADAALIFDPDSTEDIANAILCLYTDESLRRRLIKRGEENVARFSWDQTARVFRAHYRRLANRPMTNEDRQILAAPPLI